MYYRNRTKRRIGQPTPQTMQTYFVPPSVGGINSLDSIASMPPQDCLYTYNLMPSEYGLRLRKGTRQWASGLPSGCRSLVPFEGQSADSTTDRLFAVCSEGIYNITVFGNTAPNQEVAFSVTASGKSGFGVSTEFTVDNGDRYLYYADEENGLHQYSESTGLWSIPSFSPSGAGTFDVADVAYVFAWKNRLYFVVKDSSDAWYTDLAAVGGTVTKFTFGGKFTHGGELKALFSWTIDGGAGVDDYLIAVGRGGDVLVYAGQDPETEGFALTGNFFIGEIPETRRIGVNYGGELYLLSTYGLTSIRDLLQGVDSSDLSRSPSAKISRYIRQTVQDNKNEFVWQLDINPSDGFLQLIAPYTAASDAIQYTQNLLTRAWGMWRGVPANCSAAWNADYFLGTDEGTVLLYDGELEGTTIKGPDAWTDVLYSAGPEWSQPAPLEYSCDGTQAGQTAYLVQSGQAAVLDSRYDVTYTVSNYGAGNHAVRFGDGTSQFSSGNGLFVTTLEASSVSSLAGVVGDESFQGTISLVSIAKSAVLGTPIEFETLTSFQAPNSDSFSEKRVGIIRTIGYLAGTAALNVKAVYDYDIDARAALPPEVAYQGSNLWDEAIWDVDLWDYGTAGVSFPLGASGMGRVVAVAIRGSSSTRLNFAGWDVSYTVGGFL